MKKKKTLCWKDFWLKSNNLYKPFKGNRNELLFMTLEDFKLLDEPAKMELLWEKGVHVAERAEGYCRFELFQLFSFYVEEKYEGYGDFRWSFRCFGGEACELEFYLEKIDLSGLYFAG